MPRMNTSDLSSPTEKNVMIRDDTDRIGDIQEQLEHQERTPAYDVLLKHNLLETRYRKASFDDLFSQGDITPSSSSSSNLTKRCLWGYYCCPGMCCLYNATHTETFVPAGHVGLFIDDRNNFLFAKPGIHNIYSAFIKEVGCSSVRTEIIHGDRTVVTVDQGKLGYCLDKGQPVLLPPGLHSWRSDTLKYVQTYSLENHCIDVGPLTILTVDEGYAAITQNNGKQEILAGGQTHLLPHAKWRFEKFITLKIQTDELEKIQAASADNIIMQVNSTVVWKIKDVHTAALLGADTMSQSGKENEVSADITKLRRDVLKQAIASLASFIGSVNYSDSFHVAAAAQRNQETEKEHKHDFGIIDTATATIATDFAEDNFPRSKAVMHEMHNENPMFDSQGISECVKHANKITSKYGIEIMSINIISANPVDKNLTSSLASGAVAAAEALQAETAARGQAKAVCINAEAKSQELKIRSEAEALATVLNAKASAEGEEILARGKLKAAELLQTSSIAMELAKIDASAQAIKVGDKFFFGSEPEYMKNVVMPIRAVGNEIDM